MYIIMEKLIITQQNKPINLVTKVKQDIKNNVILKEKYKICL